MNPRLVTLIILALMTLLVNISFNGGTIQQARQTPEATKSISIATTASDGLVPVMRVVDGDTIVVLENGVQEKVRLIGINTPETVDPRRPVQCFGKEASAFTKSLLSNTAIKLESDTSQGDRDKYRRLLRYVFLADGTLVNKKIIEEGYGNEYTYHIPYKHQGDFKKAEHEARINKKGLWAPDSCNGVF